MFRRLLPALPLPLAALLAPALALGLALGLALAPAPPAVAAAACYADYKAKQEPPLRLQYGVMQLSPAACADPAAARAEVAARLAGQGWTLLSLVSIFGPEGLAQRKADAGEWFLRF